MLDGFWAFLKDPANRAVLGWIGAGIVTVVTGAWAVIKFNAKKHEGEAAPGIKADGKGIAIGRDNINSPINIDTRSSGKR